jgi:ABC-type transport system substrate-binding protein
VVLVVAFALPACEPTEKSGWYTPEGDLISFEITTRPGLHADAALKITEDLLDFGLDVTREVLETTTFLEYLYQPNLGAMQVYISANDPAIDPWSDWVWIMMSDPLDWGYLWNPCWYNDERYNELWVENYLAPNLSKKQEALYEMQQIVAEDAPMIFLVRPGFISVYRTDEWENWHNQLGGLISWINEYSYREVTPVDDATRLDVGSGNFMLNLNMNPDVQYYTSIGCSYLMIVYENLVGFPKIDEDSLEANPDAAYDFVPKLATNYSWSYEADGTGGQNQILTIDLREGAKWQDYDTEGKNFTADDVVFTLKYVLSKWGINKPINWTAVEDNDWEILPEHVLVTKTGDYQVEFRYIEGWHQPEEYFPSVFMWEPMVPEHIFGPALFDDEIKPSEWDGYSIGTGPFKVKEFVPDDYLFLERFDDYWGDGVEGWGLPAAQEVMYKYYSEAGPMWLALEGGGIDVVDYTNLPHPKIGGYEAEPDMEVEVMPGMEIVYLAFNLHPTEGYDPLKDQVLRQAIAYAIDKQDIVDMVYGGYGEVPDGFIYRESLMHNPDLPQYEYNPTTARNMLLAANYTCVE